MVSIDHKTLPLQLSESIKIRINGDISQKRLINGKLLCNKKIFYLNFRSKRTEKKNYWL